MSYIVQYTIAKDKAALLDSIRPQHRAHVEQWEDEVQLTALTFDEGGEAPTGAIFVLRAETRAQALQFSRDDPYVKAGIFVSPHVARFVKRRGWSD